MNLIQLGIALNANEGGAIVEPKDRYKHLFLIAATGRGKTSFFLDLINKDQENALIILDPNGDLAQRAASLISKDRLIYIDKDHPISLNPLTRLHLNKSELANELIEVINSAVSAVSPEQVAITVLMAKIIRNALRVFTPEQMNIEYLGNFLEYKDERKIVADKTGDKYWVNFDKKDRFERNEPAESAKRISARLSLFYEDENLKPFIKGENEFNISKIVKERKVVIFNLYGFDDELTAFIGSLVSHQIKSYYLHQATKDSPPLYFYVDEFSLFITDLFDRFLAESRKYNISCNFSGHSLAQLKTKLTSMILSNCYIKVAMDCGVEDAEIIAKEINCKPDRILNLNYRQYEAIVGIGKKSYHVLIPPPPDVEPYQPESISPKAQPFYCLRDAWIPY
jgi:hypothetical protein